MANDEDVRSELLEVLNAPLCAHINESQLISNPIVNLISEMGDGGSATSATIFQQSIDRLSFPEWRQADTRPITGAQIMSSFYSSYGVNIPLQLLRLLASLKDHSKSHKDLYWRSIKVRKLQRRPLSCISIVCLLQDDRLIPFIAYAIARGDREMVNDALVLFNHCTQVQEFPTQM